MRSISLIIAAIFVACAAVQWNDPDPIGWIAVYAMAAFLAAAISFVRIPGWVYAGVAVGALVWAAALLPEVISDASFTGTEVERELGGLLLVAAAMIGLIRARARRVPST